METMIAGMYPVQLRREYWQRAGEERMAAAWAMTLHRWVGQGKDPAELRMRRDTARFVRREDIDPNDF